MEVAGFIEMYFIFQYLGNNNNIFKLTKKVQLKISYVNFFKREKH